MMEQVAGCSVPDGSGLHVPAFPATFPASAVPPGPWPAVGGGAGRIVFGGEPLTQGGEPILSGTEDDVELADALALLSGTVQIGNNADAAIHLAGNVTVIDGWNMTVDGGDTTVVGGALSVDGNIDCNSGDITAGGGQIAAGTLLVDGQARFDGEVIVNALPTADGTTNHLWQDNSAARVVKVSA